MSAMLIAVLALMTADAPAAAGDPPAPTPADPVKAAVDELLEPYRGKNGDPLRGRLGLSIGSRQASDGEVVFWVISVTTEMACGLDPATGSIRCARPPAMECRLAVAFDKQNLVKAWALNGAPAACQGFVTLLKGEG
ncbi:MAG: hypothetical protein ACOY4K_08110 [Pseudomonadota bacterium]